VCQPGQLVRGMPGVNGRVAWSAAADWLVSMIRFNTVYVPSAKEENRRDGLN